jgi:hypothetical protein
LEEALAINRLHELSVLEEAHHNPTLDCGHKEHTTHRRAQEALPIARAVRETILAKRRVAAQRIAEAKLRLQISSGVLGAVDDRIRLADQQVDNLRYQMNKHKLISTSPISFTNRRRWISQRRHRFDGSELRAFSASPDGSSDDMESSSGCSSKYNGISYPSPRL